MSNIKRHCDKKAIDEQRENTFRTAYASPLNYKGRWEFRLKLPGGHGPTRTFLSRIGRKLKCLCWEQEGYKYKAVFMQHTAEEFGSGFPSCQSGILYWTYSADFRKPWRVYSAVRKRN
jgi:hypothetical protein